MADAAARAPRATAAATGAGRPAAPRRRAPAAIAQRRATGRSSPFPAGFRWLRVLWLAAAVVVGLPLAHAVFGEVVALLGGTAVLGFLIGRWTAPGG